MTIRRTSKMELAERVLANLKIQSSGEKSPVTVRCQKCQDMELIITIQDGREVAIPCECRRQRILERMVRTSGLSDELKGKSFSNYAKTDTNKEAYQAAYDYVYEFSDIKGQR